MENVNDIFLARSANHKYDILHQDSLIDFFVNVKESNIGVDVWKRHREFRGLEPLSERFTSARVSAWITSASIEKYTQ
jgi:hypothetical protein